jgi:hypothetical protein
MPLVAVGGILAWWAWKSGGYFGVTFLPGSMILLAFLAGMWLFVPWPASLTGAPRVALLGLLGIAAWTLVSALWSPVPDVAIADAQRALIYALLFALGAWLCLLLGRRMLLALAPVAVAGALVALVTLVVIWTGSSHQDYLDVDTTLRYPLGYRNAEAAFSVMSVLAMIVLIASRQLDWRLRPLLLAGATLSIELAVVAQSRGSVFGVVAGVAVLIAAHPARLRIIGWLALALIPAVVALPSLLDVYQQGGGNSAGTLGPLHAACRMMALTTVLSGVIGMLAVRMGFNYQLPAPARRAVSIVLLAALGAVVLAGLAALATTEGGPTGFISRHVDQLTAGTPDLRSKGSRFGVDLRSQRGDLWRVARDDFAEKPIAGEGAGGYRRTYLIHRDDNSVQPEDPHSVELLMASELGIVGVILFGAFAIGAVLAVLRARRLGPSAAALGAGALAIAAYWFVHASIDWFWSYPSITAPMMFAMGAAAAPALLRPAGEPRRRPRVAGAVAAALVALSMVPFFLSERYANSALRDWREDPEQAYSDLSRAADLNPWSVRPLVAEAVIAESEGDRQRALGALHQAQDRQPDEWTLYYLEARVLAPLDPAGALRALGHAAELNPRGVEIPALQQQITSQS